jgi:hypothetical protein
LDHSLAGVDGHLQGYRLTMTPVIVASPSVETGSSS